MPERPGAARAHLALALDLDDLEAARALARRLSEWFATVKVGAELFAAAGPDAVRLLRADGFAVFVDVKLYDIPTTVSRAATVLARLGAAYVTVHAAGGKAMCEAAAAAFAEASSDRPTVGLAVTALTSVPARSSSVLARARLAKRCGLGGVVCAGSDLAAVRAAAPGLVTVVPGIRPRGAPFDDQRRSSTPSQAIVAGADLLVVGRAVTAAADPALAAAALAGSVDQALSAQILVRGASPR